MGRKILLADDSITIQKVVNLTFSDEGIDVVTVGNGELALRKLNDVRPDIVLADIYMPGRNGYEVCEYIKTNPQFSQIPVLLLVGAFEPFDQAEAVRVKADGHLTKPFESRALIATVTRLLAQALQEKSAPSQSSASEPQIQASSIRQILPPDSTTTRLNPNMRPQVSPPPRYEMPKVEPIRASAVPFDKLQPPIAFPPPTAGSFSPPSNAVGEKLFARTEQQTAPVPSGFGIFDSAPKPPEPRPVDPFFFDKASSPISPDAEPDAEQIEDLELPDDILMSDEQTVAYGIPVKSIPINYSSADFDAASLDSASPLELDEVEVVSKNSTYQTTAIEGTYDDITPLDLEPIEEVNYQSSDQEDVFLEISPEPIHIEELSSIDADDADDVLEPSADPRLNTVAMAAVELVAEPVKDTVRMEAVSIPETTEMPTLRQASASTTEFDIESGFESVLDIEAAPIITEQDEVELADEMTITETPVAAVSAAEPVAAFDETSFNLVVEPIDEVKEDLSKSAADEQQVGMVFDPDSGSLVPVPYTHSPHSIVDADFAESASGPAAEDERPVAEMTGEFTFELPEEPLDLEAAKPKEEFSLEFSEEPTAAIEDIPDASSFDLISVLDEPLIEDPAEVSINAAPAPVVDAVAAPVEETVAAVSEEVVFAPLEAFQPEPDLPEAIPVSAVEESSTAVGSEPAIPVLPAILPEAIEVEAPVIVSAAHDEATVEAIPLPSSSFEPSAPAAAPVAITSMDQIPQHLMDEIVRRVVEKMSENVVREIAWDVVPDLAELLIKKRIDQKNL